MKSLLSHPKFPKGGWRYDGVKDMGPDERATCQICQKESIRYVHICVHDWYTKDGKVEPRTFMCGKVCAAKILNKNEIVEQAEKSVKSENTKKERVADKIKEFEKLEWKTSRSGNQFAVYKNNFITIIQKDTYFGIAYKNNFIWENEDHGKILSLDEAKNIVRKSVFKVG